MASLPREKHATITYNTFALTVLLFFGTTQAAHSCPHKKDTDDGCIIGGGILVSPKYMGSADYRTTQIPVLSFRRGAFFADLDDGIGMQWRLSETTRFSAALNMDSGRSTNNRSYRPGSSNLSGMGNVGSATLIDLVLEEQLADWLTSRATASLRAGGEQRGNNYSLGFRSIIMDKASDIVSLDSKLLGGDARYMQTYFGVSKNQAKSTNFEYYRPGQGIYAYAIAADWIHTLDDHWSTYSELQITNYLSKAGDSQLSKERLQGSLTTSLNYNF